MPETKENWLRRGVETKKSPKRSLFEGKSSPEDVVLLYGSLWSPSWFKLLALAVVAVGVLTPAPSATVPIELKTHYLRLFHQVRTMCVGRDSRCRVRARGSYRCQIAVVRTNRSRSHVQNSNRGHEWPLLASHMNRCPALNQPLFSSPSTLCS